MLLEFLTWNSPQLDFSRITVTVILINITIIVTILKMITVIVITKIIVIILLLSLNK